MKTLHLYQIMQFLRHDSVMVQVITIPEVPRNLLDFDPEINTDFKEDSPFKDSVISETY